MTKRATLIYIVGAIIIGIIGVLTVYFTLIATGAIDTQSHAIVFASGDAEKMYDGKPLTCKEWTITDGELQEGHTAEVTVSGTITDAGSATNEFTVKIIDEAGSDVSDRYAITCNPGTITVEKREIGIMAGSAEKVYDGTPLYNHEYTMFSGELLAGHRIEASFMGQRTDAGLGENVVSAHVIDEHENDVTHNYEIVSHTGQLEVTQRPVRVQTENLSRQYNAKPFVAEGGTVTDDYPLLTGHTYETVGSTSITKVGTIDNAVSIKIKDENGVDVTRNYKPEYSFGTLTVEPLRISVIAKSATLPYNGTERDISEVYSEEKEDENLKVAYFVENVSQGHLDELDDKIGDVEVVGCGTDVKTYATNIAYIEVINKAGEDVTDCYEIEKIPGELTIIPREITIVAGSDRKKYDGTALTCSNYDVYGDLLAIHQVKDGSVQLAGTITNIGVVQNNAFGGKIEDIATRVDVTHNYTITYAPGTLEVCEDIQSIPEDEIADNEDGTPGPNDTPVYKITGKSRKDIKIYLRRTSEVQYLLGSGETYGDHFTDGTKNNAYIYNGTLPGTSLNMNYLTSAVLSLNNVGTHTVEITKLVDTSLAIQPIYSVAQNEEKYTTTDGDMRYKYGANIYMMTHYDFDYLMSGSILALPTDYEYAQQELTYREHVYDTYLQIPTQTKTFFDEYVSGLNLDGKSTYEKISAVANAIRKSNFYNLEYELALDTVEDVAVEFIKNGIMYAGGVCRHYSQAATMAFRSLGIPARYVEGFVANLNAQNGYEVTLSSDNGAHAWVEVYIDGIGWVSVEVTGGGGGSGTPNPPNNDDDDKKVGRPATVRKLGTNSDVLEVSETYDSREGKYLSGWGLTALCQQEGYYYTAEAYGKQVGWGRSAIAVKNFKMYTSGGVLLTEEEVNALDVAILPGEVQIYAQELTLTTRDLIREYDGTELRDDVNDPYYDTALTFGECYDEISRSDFVFNNHKLKLIGFENSATDVGIVDNVVKYDIVDSEGKSVRGMYYVREKFGNVEVKLREITIATATYWATTGTFDPDYSKVLTRKGYAVYKGKSTAINNEAILEGSAQILNNALAPGHVIDIEVTGQVIGYGEAPNTYVLKGITFAGFGDDLRDNYKINSKIGTLTVQFPI